jgi:two-component system sensor histidine kinase HydH
MTTDRSEWLARAIPVLVALVVAALVASQVLAWLGIRRAADAADRGEAQALLEAVGNYVGRLDGRLEEGDLDAFVDARRELGLRYAAASHPRGGIEGGEGLLRDPQPPETFVRAGGRLRATNTLGPRPGAELPPPSGPRHPPPPNGHPPHEGRPPPVTLTVEIEPRLSPVLRRDALRTMVAAAITACLFLLLGLALRRVVEEREVVARRAARDRHLASLGAMSAVLGHEIRNPLASLKGHAQLLSESLPERDESQAKVERIVADAVRLEEITSNLLEFVRSGDLHFERVDVADLVRNAMDAVDRERFQLRVGDGSTTATVDPARVTQTLINLLANAEQASAERAEVAIYPHRDRIEITVSDRGPGIEIGQEQQIFEPFHTTRVRGTGLGLAVAKRIVEAHRGSIRAENRAEGGATFTVCLPRRGPRED